MPVRSFKGYQVSGGASVAQVAEAIAEGATIIRYQINPQRQLPWREQAIVELEHFKQVLLSIHIRVQVVLDLHWAPKENRIEEVKWFWSKAFEIVGVNSRLIYGVLNEPDEAPTSNAILMRAVYHHIRSLSKKVTIAVSSAYGDPLKLRHVPFFDGDSKVWYEFHFYNPMSFSHQGTPQYPTVGKKFPTASNSVARMKAVLAQAYAFRRAHPNAQLFVGEFSCIDFADDDSRSLYIRECILRWKELRAHWCFHAWREWEHWQPAGKTLEVLRRNMK